MVKKHLCQRRLLLEDRSWCSCTGGASAMPGNTSGLAAFLKKSTPHVIMTHGLLYPHAMNKRLCQQFWGKLCPLPWKDQLYQSQGFKSLISACFDKGWKENINFFTMCSKRKLLVVGCILRNIFTFFFSLSFIINLFTYLLIYLFIWGGQTAS